MEQLLFTVKDHYLALFSPLGELAKTFPVNISLAETEERSLRISLNITSDYKSYNADTLKAPVHAVPANAGVRGTKALCVLARLSPFLLG